MKNKTDFLCGIILSVGVTVLLVFIFALFVKWLGMGSATVRVVNQFIKIIALWVGLWVFLKERGMISGGIFGAVYMVITTLVFALIGGSFSWSIGLLFDLAFCVVGGVLGGLIPVNCKRGKN